MFRCFIKVNNNYENMLMYLNTIKEKPQKKETNVKSVKEHLCDFARKYSFNWKYFWIHALIIKYLILSTISYYLEKEEEIFNERSKPKEIAISKGYPEKLMEIQANIKRTSVYRLMVYFK